MLNLVSKPERDFIVGGIRDNVRADGRERHDIRRIEAELGVVPQATGSARVRMGGNDAIVAVKAEIGAPKSNSMTDGGFVTFSVECSPMAHPAFRGRGGDELGNEIAQMLERSFHDGPTARATGTGALDHESLSIVSGKTCWLLYVDALILDIDGAIGDVVSMAVKLALHDAKLPRVEVIQGEGAQNEFEYEVDDDPEVAVRLDVSGVPLFVTACEIGSSLILDPTADELEVASSTMTVAVDKDGKICSLAKHGFVEMQAGMFMEAMMLARKQSQELHKATEIFSHQNK